ncbi:LegC family aminotransferase [Dyadobacter sp. CY312]|uniref:LegC family aminotransferase n=1 Tax=Dyadobacter sp. CY312 TaxID=2907303 RepID=UPI001F3ECC87|nr:LegC family aminotransferase [Dyadobacter sp. CY312]MCE7039687.1 LegC family aminotransferase [Dyadobacter sp. CY312]
MEISNPQTIANIPLCEPNLAGNESKYITEAIASNWLSGGRFVNSFEEQLCEFTKVKYAVGVSSGTTALHISLIIAGVEENDLVLVPNLTFVATANAVKYLKADPVLIDVDRNSWVLDINLIREFLETQSFVEGDSCFHKYTKRRIKAILPVHLLGNMCDMGELLTLAEQYHLVVIEDAACSLGSFQNGKHSGTFGLMGTLSFNSNKIITTGGGGAILTNNEDVAKRARFLITQAKSPGIEYLHTDVGYNYRLVNPLAAIGAAQMEQLNHFILSKKKSKEFYCESLNLTSEQIQNVTINTDSNFWHFVMLHERSRELIKYLSQQNIETRPVWLPINELPVFKNDIYIHTHNCSKQISDLGIMLPCSTSITEMDLNRVCSFITKFNQI